MAEDIGPPKLQKAGSVVIEELILRSSNNETVDLKEFLVELNVYEDIFSNTMYGDVVLSDSRNIIDSLPIIGEETLDVTFYTPSFNEANQIVKNRFRVFRLTNRKVVRDNNTQLFTLHFGSLQLFTDILNPLYVHFEFQNISEAVQAIFGNFLKIQNGYLDKDIEISSTSNPIKYNSPGWTPIKNLNWLASKAMPGADVPAGNSFLFFESNKSFYFTSLGAIFKAAHEQNKFAGDYTYVASNLKTGTDDKTNLQRQFFIVNDLEMTESVDQIRNYTNGYLANRLISLDVFNKTYNLIEFDYVSRFNEYYHTAGQTDVEPLFTREGSRNSFNSIDFKPVNPRLFQTDKENYFKDNWDIKMPEIYGNRKSALLGMTLAKLNITVPGRTDIEVGRMIYLNFPKLGPVDETDNAKENIDQLYSGYYLITAIHHKVTGLEHVMIMEIVKDSRNYKK